MEIATDMRNKIEALNPRLKAFHRGERSVIVCGIRTILSLVSHAKSHKPASLAHEFDIICKRLGLTKPMSLYQERRFVKFGYLAGAI